MEDAAFKWILAKLIVNGFNCEFYEAIVKLFRKVLITTCLEWAGRSKAFD